MKEALKANKALGLKFLAVGGAGFIFNYGVLKLSFTVFGLSSIISEIVAAIAALQLTFFLHDRWTYTENTARKYHRPLRQRYVIYLASNSLGSIMTVVFFSILSLIMNHLPALAIAAILAMIWNFMVNRLFIWKHTQQDIEA